jgi:hypothetical protein
LLALEIEGADQEDKIGMGMYNILALEFRCPHCRIKSNMEIEFKFGLLNLDRYELGSKMQWRERKGDTRERRPAGGDYKGEGYVECPNCHNDFWVVIGVQNDVIEKVELDKTRKGYIK